MTVRISNGAVALLIAGRTLPRIFDNGTMQVFAGDMPTSPETPPGNLKLAEVVGAAGATLPLYQINGTFVGLRTDQNWVLRILAPGTPGFVRITGDAANSNAVILTNQHNIPEITSTSSAIDLTTFYFTFAGQG